MITDFECLDGAVVCSTLTTEEAAGCLRYAGIKVSPVTLREGIEQGKFPFGFMIEGSSRIFIVSRFQLEQWIEAFTGISVSVDQILEDVKNI